MTVLRDVLGQRFDRLVVVERVIVDGYTRWRCRCDCGGETIVEGGRLKLGKACRSLGCPGCRWDRIQKNNVRHGGCSGGRISKLWSVWYGMRTRCEKPGTTSYPWYGAKGIAVCAEWQDFGAFQKWALAHGYAEGLSIDRLDSGGDYCPGNCEWVTRSENSRRGNAATKARKLAEKALA